MSEIPDLGRTFGDAVRIVRLARGETQSQFAKVLGVSRYQLSTWERGRAAPEPLMVQSIAQASKGTTGSVSEKTLLMLWYRSKVGLDKPRKVVLPREAILARADAVRKRRRRGESVARIARAYGLDHRAVQRILRGAKEAA